MIKSYISCFVLMIITVLAETSLLSNIYFLPAIPDFMLLCLIYVSVKNGKTFGEVNGFLSGLLLDFLSGTPFGLNCLLRSLFGYTCGAMKKMLNIESVWVSFCIGFFATLYKALIVFVISLLFPNYVNSYHLFSMVFAFELGFNTLLAPVVFKVLKCFNDFLVYENLGIN